MAESSPKSFSVAGPKKREDGHGGELLDGHGGELFIVFTSAHLPLCCKRGALSVALHIPVAGPVRRDASTKDSSALKSGCWKALDGNRRARQSSPHLLRKVSTLCGHSLSSGPRRRKQAARRATTSVGSTFADCWRA